MNASFKPVSAALCLDGVINQGGHDGHLSGSSPRQTVMLILLVATALIGSFIVEMLVRQFRNNYEIEWPAAVVVAENSMALEIAATLRRAAGNLNGK
jgi:hypothetical protein